MVFSPTNNEDPTNNGKQYTLYLKPGFFNRSAGLSILLLLSLTLTWFLIFVLKSPTRRKSLLTDPFTTLNLLDDFFVSEISRTFIPITNTTPLHHSKRELWTIILLLTIGASFFYVFMEWIFFVTKPSFMDFMGWLEKIEILLVPSFGLMVSGVVLVLVIAGLDWIISRFRQTRVLIFVGSLVPTIILAAISLILVDNFTYTIFNFGIVSSTGFVRFLYALGFITLCIFINRWILGLMGLRGESQSSFQVPNFIRAALVAIFIVSAIISIRLIINSYRNNNAGIAGLADESSEIISKPNIILIGSDGLNATNMSLYGYERDTTPVMSELGNTSLVAENVFANASNSAGSIISILTGKPPARTRVLYPPNILEGANAIQHLPGILRDEGYEAYELGVPHYVDASKANLLEGFTVVNDREIGENEGIQFARKLGLGNISYFLSQMSDRIVERILHIYFIREMGNPFATITQTTDTKHDTEQLDQLLTLLRESDDPLFVHVHLMGTHGPRFDPQEKEFSIGRSQEEDWSIDFYDDSILNFDRKIGRLLDTLEQSGEINNTILIIYSDHPMQFNVRWRMPLVFHFPDHQFAGRIETNVQNLDIAPTILDFLNIDPPEWMEGQSLLNDNTLENDLIFSSGTSLVTRNEQRRWVIESAQVKPPFFQFSFFNIINCQNWYQFDIITKTWESGEVPGHTMPCASDKLLSMEEIEEALAEYLVSNRFDISTLPIQ
jgi:arylsulfatase A-like enzyme